MEAFSDGVFAIAITLLVLELAVPLVGDAQLLPAILERWPSYLAYLVSFATIGAIWIGHVTMAEYLAAVSPGFLRLNLVLLLFVALLPFPTRLLAENLTSTDNERVAVTVYGAVLWIIALVLSALWRYALKDGLIRSDRGSAEIRLLTRRLTPGRRLLPRRHRGGPVLPDDRGLRLPPDRHRPAGAAQALPSNVWHLVVSPFARVVAGWRADRLDAASLCSSMEEQLRPKQTVGGSSPSRGTVSFCL